MKKKKFTRKIEDFTCENCNTFVKGSGYTNHCPKCLWSKHVDINPGDRLSDCLGMMEPIGVISDGGEYVLIHKCIICGYKKRNKSDSKDNIDIIIKLSSQPIKE